MVSSRKSPLSEPEDRQSVAAIVVQPSSPRYPPANFLEAYGAQGWLLQREMWVDAFLQEGRRVLWRPRHCGRSDSAGMRIRFWAEVLQGRNGDVCFLW
ncbi:hypothetical protein ACFX13_008605 [Malus domestica]